MFMLGLLLDIAYRKMAIVTYKSTTALTHSFLKTYVVSVLVVTGSAIPQGPRDKCQLKACQLPDIMYTRKITFRKTFSR